MAGGTIPEVILMEGLSLSGAAAYSGAVVSPAAAPSTWWLLPSAGVVVAVAVIVAYLVVKVMAGFLEGSGGRRMVKS